MKKYLYLFLVFVLFGCVSNHEFYTLQNHGIHVHKYVHIDPQFGGIERRIIQESLEEWTRVTSGFISWTVKEWPEDYATHATISEPEENSTNCSKHLLIMRSLSDDAMIINIETTLGSGISGYAYGSNEPCGVEYILLVTDKLDNHSYFRLVVLHELGHVLGLEHNEQMSVMSYKNMIYANGITKYDLEQLIKIHQP